MATPVIALSVRLPEDVHRELTAEARRQERTVNAQITFLVKCWLDERREAQRMRSRNEETLG